MNLPEDLVDASESGRLVLFVGAGASLEPPSGLPLFGTLVKRIAQQLSIDPPGDDSPLDEFLGHLVDSGNRVHQLVHDQLDIAGSAPNGLHRALVGLAAAHGHLRIVTTNYDRHLETAATDLGFATEVYEAPALPVGNDFEGIVYLHGSLDQDSHRLVVTDSDFGRAYLTDAWAARFLERMFGTYDVLFVGYSHDDVVMRYVARGMRPAAGIKRFATTSQPAHRKWRQLGISPLGYPVEDGDHGALTVAIERWQKYSKMGLLEHRERIHRLASQQTVPLEPENRSYLELSLHLPERVQFFTEVAAGADWLRWASESAEFDELVSGGRCVGEAAEQLAPWLASQVVTPGDAGGVGLEVLASRDWSLTLWRAVADRLATLDGPVPLEFAPWFYLLLDRTIDPSEADLARLLVDSDLSTMPAVAIRLFERASHPAPMSRRSLVDGLARVEAGLRCHERALRRAWTGAIEPLLATHAEVICGALGRNIAAADEVESIASGASEVVGLGFWRNAIEPHPQDEYPEALDVLIDTARDSIERLIDVDDGAVSRVLGTWADSGAWLLRRLAIHGWAARTGLDPDAKIRWLLNTGWLFNGNVRHEAFRLIELATPAATAPTRSRLLKAALAGPPDKPSVHDSERRRRWNYSRYNMLVWLHRVDPDWDDAAAQLDALQAEHSDFSPRPHPDMTHWMTTGFAEDAPPVTVSQFHRMVIEDAGTAMGRLEGLRSNTMNLTGPTWDSARETLEHTVASHPADGVRVAPLLTEDDLELKTAIIRGWSAATVDRELGEKVLPVLRAWSAVLPGEIGRLLAAGGREGSATRWHERAEYCRLAEHLWPMTPEPSRVSGDDGVTEALNSVAGDLACFWINVVQSEWRSSGDDWAGMSLKVHRILDRMMNDTGTNGQYARAILLSRLHFLFAADETWAIGHLFPLLDWSSNAEQTRQSWDSVLRSVQMTPRVLEMGLLDGLVDTAGHAGDLSDEARNRLAIWLAEIAVHSPDSPCNWMPKMLHNSSEGFRTEWAVQVGYSLSQAPHDVAGKQWDRWIQGYWQKRTESIPIPLTTKEASAMVAWVIALPEHAQLGIELACRVNYEPSNFSMTLHSLLELDLTTVTQSWAQLVVHMLIGQERPFHFGPELRDVVRKLREADPDVDLNGIREQALSLGVVDAARW